MAFTLEIGSKAPAFSLQQPMAKLIPLKIFREARHLLYPLPAITVHM